MRITLCQLNPVMGDIDGNTRMVVDTLDRVATDKPDLVVFPELFVQGYPPRDLLERPSFVQQGLQALERLCEASKGHPGVGILIGFAMPNRVPHGHGLSNAAVLIADGGVVFHQNKSLLPSYDVFDETRYFDPAREIDVFAFKGETLGITICEDAWNRPELLPSRLYDIDPVEQLARKGATIVINVSGSPFHAEKDKLRHELMAAHASKHGLPVVFVNQVGGNDELIFDGSSMYFDKTGTLRALAPSFEACTLTVDTRDEPPALVLPSYEPAESIYRALVLGTRDYVRKCGFSRVFVGLSGGIDSAVTACIAAEAVGPEQVTAITMPSRYSSEGSVSDSRILADNLGITLEKVAIESMFAAFLEALEPHFEGREPDVAEENIQARCRGVVLMAFANKFRGILLSTGNKSEVAVGYCTLYGDMNGGLSVISDVPKTMVYRLARYVNRDREIIPEAIITKPPSAELRPGQRDEDTLPPYEVLDEMLRLIIEEGRSRDEVVEAGFDAAQVDWVVRAVRVNEYKRRQAAPGLKVTPKAFGMGRRFPIAARYAL
ncbi:MAG: NAD+ synthase [Chitinivibrionales bacterium]|nr:NAD+ synthase [Chitinivibrionales bacterium]